MLREIGFKRFDLTSAFNHTFLYTAYADDTTFFLKQKECLMGNVNANVKLDIRRKEHCFQNISNVQGCSSSINH